MMEDLELLDNYLEGTLSEAKQKEVETRLQQDSRLQGQLEELRTIREGIANVSRKQVLMELKALEQTLPAVDDVPIVPLWRRTWLQVAATVLIAMVAYILWPASVSEQELFAEYFEPYPNIIMPTVRGSVVNDSTAKAKAYRAYDREEYEKAIALFESVESKDEGVLLYIGNCYLANSQPEKALPLLEKLLNDYSVFDEQTEWYIAVCYLKLEEREKAKAAMQVVAKRRGSYQQKAERVLENLN